MQLFATLLIAASLAASALAASISRISARNTVAPNYFAGTQVGQGTWYETGLGACGITNKDTDYIIAVSTTVFDTYPGYNGVNPNTNPICGNKIKATYQGKSVTVTVTDRCTGCKETDLDFSPAAFSQLANQSVGRLDGMTWSWDC